MVAPPAHPACAPAGPPRSGLSSTLGRVSPWRRARGPRGWRHVRRRRRKRAKTTADGRSGAVQQGPGRLGLGSTLGRVSPWRAPWLVLDPFVRLTRIDENSAAEVSAVLGALRDGSRLVPLAGPLAGPRFPRPCPLAGPRFPPRCRAPTRGSARNNSRQNAQRRRRRHFAAMRHAPAGVHGAQVSASPRRGPGDHRRHLGVGGPLGPLVRRHPRRGDHRHWGGARRSFGPRPTCRSGARATRGPWSASGKTTSRPRTRSRRAPGRASLWRAPPRTG